MDKLLTFWGFILWLLLEFWITDPDSRKARIVEIIIGIAYLIGGSFVIVISEIPIIGIFSSFISLIGIYHISGASSEELAPWDCL